MARTIDKRIMLDLIIEAKKTDPEAGPFSEWLAEYLVDHLPTLTPPNEWVSVEERLPDTAGEFLVVYHPCYWDNVSAEICIGIDSFRGKTAWAKRKYQRVTHWMPLPEPPKED